MMGFFQSGYKQPVRREGRPPVPGSGFQACHVRFRCRGNRKEGRGNWKSEGGGRAAGSEGGVRAGKGGVKAMGGVQCRKGAV